jgi:uroporphyrinogen decarboxylase
MRRREFLMTGTAGVLFLRLAKGAAGKALDPKERVDRALRGSDVDRPPFSFWHHFGLHTPQEHAQATLAFHDKYRTDIVKVMSDFPYPKAQGSKWYELKVTDNPFPQQIEALRLILDGLGGKKYFIETVFNSWNVAEKLSSKEELRRLKAEKPEALLNALETINKSQINHAKRALNTGASGILLSVANANAAELSPGDYARFSAPFDKELLAAIGDSKLTFLHLHVEAPYLDQFTKFQAPVINYSDVVSRIPIETVRQKFSQVIAGGVDEVNYKTLNEAAIRQQIAQAKEEAGTKLIITPGCSVPNDSSAAELLRMPRALGMPV